MNALQWLKSAVKGAIGPRGVSFLLGRRWLEDRFGGVHEQIQALTAQVHEMAAILRSRADVLGHTMYLHPEDGVVSPTLLKTGWFEPLETDLFARVVRPGDVVLDLGANIGYYTLLFARLVGDAGKVIGFEPDPANFRLLRKNVLTNGYRNVVLHQKAAAHTTGTLQLFLCDGNKGDHRLYDSGDGRPAIRVETVTVDDALAGWDGPVDVIKMDIQGAEPMALLGMQETLARNPGVKIVTEFWPQSFERTGYQAEAFLRQLEGLGFTLWNIDDRQDVVRPTTPAELLEAYGPGKLAYTNLYCVRGDADIAARAA
ncbi:MAG: FkbM family methyltransferase [Gemmataceae bacterium]